MSDADWKQENSFVLRHVSGNWITKYLVGGKPIYVPFVRGEAGENCESPAEAKKIIERNGKK